MSNAHGAQFDIKTGRVVAGPAEEKIEAYDIEVRNNEVYVKDPAEEIKSVTPPSGMPSAP